MTKYKILFLVFIFCFSSKLIAHENNFKETFKSNYYKHHQILNIRNKFALENIDPVFNNDNKKFKIIKDIGYAIKIFLSDLNYITKSPTKLNRKNMLWLGGLTLTSAILYNNDEKILSTIKGNIGKNGYKQILKIGNIFEPIGYMGNTNKYYFAGLGIGYIFKIKKLETFSAQIIEANFIAGIYKNIANIIVGRARPHEGKGARFFKFNNGTSFPSGHTVVIFNLATILSHHVNYLPFTIMSYGIATTVGFQRIESRAHYASDVFIGAVLGIAVSKTIILLHQKRTLKISPVIMQNSMIGMKITALF